MKIRLLPALAVALALSVSGCGGAEPTASTPSAPPSASASPEPTPGPSSETTPEAAPAGQSIEVSVAGGEVSGDTGRVDVPAGESVTITVVSDVADEVHLHGYDVSAPVSPGAPATLTFQATIPGVFEVELEGLGKQLLSVQVA